MNSIFDLLYPPRCPVCDGVRFFNEPVCCPPCREKLRFIDGPACMCCGRPLQSADTEYCYDCAKRKRSYERGISLGVYEGALKDSVLRFKFSGREEYAAFYAACLAERYRKQLHRFRPDVILPVPMHKRKERKRGYNQAASLARDLSGLIGIPTDESILLRTRYTSPQKELNDVARLQNLLKAFAVEEEALSAWKKDHPFQRVILVDDIYTTGSTMEACASLLRRAGAEAVMPVTVAVAGGYMQ